MNNSSRQIQSNYRLQRRAANSSTMIDRPFTQEDLADVGTRHRNRWQENVPRKALLAFSACLIAFVLIGIIAGSKPDLSAADIILMDGYGGRQTVPQPTILKSRSQLEPKMQPGSLLEISAQNHSGGLQALTPQIINKHFGVAQPDPAIKREIQWSVLEQWSNLRTEPNINGDIITSLDKNESVTVLGQTDQWLHVVTSAKQRGYMHRSVLRAN